MFKEIRAGKILTRRERIILYFTLLIVSVSTVFNLFIVPLFKRNSKLNEEIEITQKRLLYYRRLLSQKDYLQKKFNRASSYLNVASESQDVFISLLSTLEDLARQAHIRIIEIRPQEIKKLDLYKEIYVDVKTEGILEDYLRFIYGIENSLAILNIKRFQINARPDSTLLEGSFYISQFCW
ncbi:MAG: type 4a pilus biogenesis protein PilO [Candidatus Omnitrophica bacterium]|nr:type 4a pilus biogenesis protein PilO [Candidatus Omnitrophota bacterium]